MFTVWKYPLHQFIKGISYDFEVEMPKDANILSVQMQGIGNGEQPCMWAHVNSENPKETRYFEIVGTGNPGPEYKEIKQFIGTYQISVLVFHLFELWGKK